MHESEGERWLSYLELGELLGITPAAARMHAARRRWPRRSPNQVGQRAMVLVPDDVVVQPRAAAVQRTFDTPPVTEPNGADHEMQICILLGALNTALRLLEEERQRSADLQLTLADAQAAAGIAAGELLALRTQVDRLRERGLLARLRGALTRA